MLDHIIDWLAYLEHLQVVSKEFNVIMTFIDNLFIWYFWDILKLLIYSQIDEKDKDLADWQEVIELTIYFKAKTTCQIASLL